MKFNIEMTALELKAVCENGTLLRMVGDVVDAGEGRVIPKKEDKVEDITAQKPAGTTPTVTPVAQEIKTSTVSYSLDDLQKAASKLMDNGLIADLQQVISDLGVESLMSLPVEKYGEFATRIRQLGADI